jgi:RNA polymerase sigma-70 factor (ECF subfamily)
MSNDSLIFLLRRFKTKGKDANAAFGEFMALVGPKLYAASFRILRSNVLTDDAMQNTAIVIWKRIETLKEEAVVFTWCYRIATNEALKIKAIENKRKTQNLDEQVLEFYDNTSQLYTQSAEEMMELLMKAVQTLPEKQALVFQLRYFDEEKYSDIARLTNTSEGSLKASYHLAVQKINQFLRSQLNL